MPSRFTWQDADVYLPLKLPGGANDLYDPNDAAQAGSDPRRGQRRTATAARTVRQGNAQPFPQKVSCACERSQRAIRLSFGAVALSVVWRRGLVAGDRMRQRLDFAPRQGHRPAARAGGAIRDRSQPLENPAATSKRSLGALSGWGPWRHSVGLPFALRARELAARIF